MRQTEVFFLHADDVRRQDYAAGVAGPVQAIEGGVVFGQIGIAAVAEDTFDEIEIADQASRHKEPSLHRFRFFIAGGRTNERTEQERGEDVDLVLLMRCEWQSHRFGRRSEGRTY